jgi:hypothetical protein
MNSAGDDIRLRMPGFPIRKSPDQSLLGGSPKLIAASHVLHRLLAPRHSPCALSSLTTKGRESHSRLSSDHSFGRYPTIQLSKTGSIPGHGSRRTSPGRKLRRTNLSCLTNYLWWSGPGLNRQPPACKADALPIELPPRHPLLTKEQPRSAHSAAQSNRRVRDNITGPNRWWA